MAQEYTFRQEETGPLPPEQEQQQQPQQTGDRPDWLPPEFNSVEAFVKSSQDTKAAYTKARQELAALRGTPDEEETEEPEDESSIQNGQSEEEIKGESLDQAAEKITKEAGVDVSEYTKEYYSSGDLTPESRDALAEALKGVLGDDARQMIDDYVEAKKVVHQNNSKTYMDEAGGTEQYQAMVQWAAESLPPEQITAYNKAVESGDRHSTLFAIRGLRAQYEAANGRAPNLRSGTGPSGNVAPFQSAAEMRAAMSDPRYKSDPAYREAVARRLAISDNF